MKRIWRKTDEAGLEVFALETTRDGFCAVSTIVHAGADPFGATYVWQLDGDLRTRRLDLRLTSPTARELTIERLSNSWRVDGRERPDLAACQEIDVSATPFCNSLALRRLGGSGELTALYVDLPSLQVSPSKQRYVALGPKHWRYRDLGVAAGFEAELRLDDDGFVLEYEGLFETIG